MPENAEAVTVTFKSNVTASVQTKAQGGVDAWNGRQNLYVYGFQRQAEAIDYSTADPFINNVAAISPVEGAGSNAIEVLDKDDNKPFYYNGNFTYDFYGYYVDDLDVEPVADASGVRVPLVLTGGEDIMLAKADPVADVAKARSNGTFTGDNTWNDQYAYSAYAARRGVQPTLKFEHQLVQFKFNIESGSAKAEEENLKVTALTLDALNTADLYVAGANLGFQNVSTELATLNLFDFQGYEVPNAGAEAAKIGDCIMVIPNTVNGALAAEDTFSGKVYLTQEAMTEAVPVDFTLKFSEVKDVPVNAEGLPVISAFEAGYSFDVTIKVYSLEKIEISAELTEWVNGGNVNIDTDEAPEIF
jgi:hypothetical protein